MRLKSIALTAASFAALAIPASAQLAGGNANAALILHQDTNQRGAAYPTDTALPDLSRIRFNDQVSSITVNDGFWELCTDGNYRGRCEIVESSIQDLRAIGLNDAISSARRVSSRPAPHPHPDRPDINEDAPIVFYERTGLRGRALPIESSTRSFGPFRFNDLARSVRVNSGVWRLCTDSNYGGRCEFLDNTVRDLSVLRLSGNISSVELTPYRQGPGSSDIALFNRSDYRGEFLGFDEAVQNLASYNFNDTAGSIMINRGTWLVCEDANYRGRCEVVDASLRNLDQSGLDNRISSLRPYDPRRDDRYRRAGGYDDGYGSTGGYGDDDDYDHPNRRGPGGNSERGIRGEQSVFFPVPRHYGERIRNGDGAATRFCRDKGYETAVYKGRGRVLSDVLCR